MLSDQLQEIARHARPVLEAHGVIQASVFGSFARGEQTLNSDVDLLVEFDDTRNLLDLVSLSQELPKALGRPVDVFTYDSIARSLKARILSEQQRIL